jgi:hypothetical protein
MTDAEEIVAKLAEFRGDPIGFVQWAFPWGEGELAGYDGPFEWQTKVLDAVKDGLPLNRAIRIAVVSGHGVGKSSLIAWLVLWSMSTAGDTRGVVTAGTEDQLRTKLWAELAKWHRLFVARQFFTLGATSLVSADPAHERQWRMDGIPWTERSSQSFAGLHNQGKRLAIFIDEASTVADVIFEVIEGALTDRDTEILWVVFGNPISNVGRFREIFEGREAGRWFTLRVDSRDVPITNQKEIEESIAFHGEDSDYVRRRFTAQFPRQGATQFFPSDQIEGAMQREASSSALDDLVMGVDVGWQGDESVTSFRRGFDARTIPAVRLHVDPEGLFNRILLEYRMHRPRHIFIDAGGMGGPLCNRLQHNRLPVIGVMFGGKPEGFTEVDCANRKAELYAIFREHLNLLALPPDKDLRAQMIAVEAELNRQGRLQIESKQDLRRRGLPSPDFLESLTLTVAQGINNESFRDELLAARPGQAVCEYDPFDPDGIQKADRRGQRYYAEGWARLRDDDYSPGNASGW